MAKQRLAYKPDYAVAPGATLKELLDDKGISQTSLATRTGMAEKTISQIINGIAPITYDTAEKLDLALGVPARYWNQRELEYREALTKCEAAKQLESELAWLREVPVKVLQERGYVDSNADKADLIRLVLGFFGVSSVAAWREAWGKPIAQYRSGKAKDKHPGFVAAWLRIGDLQAESVDTSPFSADEFKHALADARKMTNLSADEWIPKLRDRCAAAGVAVVFTKEIPTASVSGATRWATKDKAIIQLSLKFRAIDSIWFTFFHEAGHILHHSKKQMFLDFGVDSTNDEEREADGFARDFLIPRVHAARLPYLKTRPQILTFAESIGVSAAIVVGRLHHENLAPKSAFHDLRPKLRWKK